jgi:ABC-type transport system involved in cytochrome bd biosynthesis fused ATPase/permease subunit
VVSAIARARRHEWDDRSFERLSGASSAQLHEIDVAVDHLADSPALDAGAAGAFTALLALVIVAATAGWLSVLVVAALMALSVPAYASAGRRSEAAASEYHRRRGAIVARQLALLRAMVDLRALGAVRFGADEVASASAAEGRAVLEGVRATIRSSLITEFLGGVSVGLVAMIVGIRLWHHSIALLDALIAVFAVAEMFGWLRRYGAEFHRRDDARQAAVTLSTLTTTTPVAGSSDPIDARGIVTEAPCGAVDLVVRSGERVRLSGPSGSGKTSLIEAALGLREPLAGTVARSGVRVGLVRADSRLLRASLRENLDPRGARDDDVILATVEAVGLSPTRFGDLDEMIDDDGRSISSGERVQLALARALLTHADVIVLDDVAGLLDESTRERLSALLAERVDLTIVEAAHDTSLVAPERVIELGTT